jgi:hypothetical protein
MTRLLEHDPVVQRYRAFFALFDWEVVPDPFIDPSQPGKRPHLQSASLKALLLKLEEGFASCIQLRRYLVEHPLLVLELGFRPFLNRDLPYGFDVGKTVPSARWLREQQHSLSQSVLQALLAASVRDLREEIPGLGEVVAFEVTHLYAYVKQNNERAYVKERYNPARQPAGDRDCKPLVKRSTNKEQAHGSSKEEKEYRLSLWLWGSQRLRGRLWRGGPCRNDPAQRARTISAMRVPLFLRSVAVLGFFPTHITADAAFDGRSRLPAGGPSWGHRGHPAEAGTAILRASGLLMACRCVPKACACTPPLSSPIPTATVRTASVAPCSFRKRLEQHVSTPNLLKAKAVLKTSSSEPGGQMPVTLDGDSPLYHAMYDQRTNTERDPQSVQRTGHQAAKSAQPRLRPHSQPASLPDHQCPCETSRSPGQCELTHHSRALGRLRVERSDEQEAGSSQPSHLVRGAVQAAFERENLCFLARGRGPQGV